MRKLKSLITVMLFVAVIAPLAFADDDGIGIDVTADFYSKYVWRGQLLNDDYAFQPGVSTTLGNLTLGVWGSLDMTDYANESGNFTEVDYYADYTTALTDGVDISLGVIYYDFPQIVGDTTEIYVGLAFDTFLSPSITWYHDVDDVDDASYFSFAVGHSIEEAFDIGTDIPVGIDLGASLGYGNSNYNKGYWGDGLETGGGFNDLALSLSLPFEMGGWSVTPSFNYVTIIDSDLRDDTTFGTASDHFFTGISIGTSF